MNSVDIVFHVGMPRTATSKLQQDVFPLLDVQYIDSGNAKNIIECLRRGVYCRDAIVDAYDGSSVMVISDENIYNDLFSGVDARWSNIRNIYKMFPEARILIGTRGIGSFLRSMYGHYLRFGGTRNYKDFLGLEIVDVSRWLPDKYVSYCHRLFDDVYVYRYADFRRDAGVVLAGICEWIGVDMPDVDVSRRVNPSPYKYRWLLRGLNFLFRTKADRLGIIPWLYADTYPPFLFIQLLGNIQESCI